MYFVYSKWGNLNQNHRFYYKNYIIMLSAKDLYRILT